MWQAALAAGLLFGSSSESGAQSRASKPAPPAARVEVARLGFAEGGIEVQVRGAAWLKASEGQSLAIGDRVRTLRGGTARLEFPWTAIAVGDNSEVVLENPNHVLTLRLESGRIDVDPEHTLVRVVTDEGAVSGVGRTLVRRVGGSTFVGSYNGGADVESRGSVVRLGVNKGVLLRADGPAPVAAPMSEAPRVVTPGADPRYVLPNTVVPLRWTGREEIYHLEVLSIDSDVPVVSIDLNGKTHDLQIPWLGTFRWRISGLSGAVESEPSSEGLICVTEK